MIEPTKFYLFIFGILTIAGGVMGFVKAGSNASLIAGGIAGLALLVAGYLLMAGKTQPGLILGLVLSLALAGQFVPKFLSAHKFMPAGMMSILAIIGLGLTITSLVVKR